MEVNEIQKTPYPVRVASAAQECVLYWCSEYSHHNTHKPQCEIIETWTKAVTLEFISHICRPSVWQAAGFVQAIYSHCSENKAYSSFNGSTLFGSSEKPLSAEEQFGEECATVKKVAF